MKRTGTTIPKRGESPETVRTVLKRYEYVYDVRHMSWVPNVVARINQQSGSCNEYDK